MENTRLYEDIALRTGGDIYVGVVGPVRTGKSTFIKKFMELMVIPGIENVYARERAKDELPQSGSGRTVMTAEPKFVPEDAAKLKLENGMELSVRLIDCVGYMVPGAAGQLEDGRLRMVTTPWFDEEIDFAAAASEGTLRVIRDHSTVGLVMTTDGSICGIDRRDYEQAEELAIAQLREIGKPFVLLLNSSSPDSADTQRLRMELEEKYQVSCLCLNCLTMDAGDIDKILSSLLYEFGVESFSVSLPQWADALPAEHHIRQELYSTVMQAAASVQRLKDCPAMLEQLRQASFISRAELSEMQMGTGCFTLLLELPRRLYYDAISEECGFSVTCDRELISLLQELAQAKREYDKVSQALNDVRQNGYGVVLPSPEDMKLQEPEIVRQGGKYSVVLRAGAPAIHMLKTDVVTEVSPAVGGETASEEILGFLLQNFEGDASKIWESNIFGKSMYDIAGEGLTAKITRLPLQTGHKLRNALERIVNEGSGGLICIIL